MSHIIYLAAFVINAINGFSKKKSKVIYIIFLALLLLMFCQVTTSNYQHLDYKRGDNEAYEQWYNLLRSGSIVNLKQSKSVEKGFTLYTFFLAKIGLPYGLYMAVTFILGILLSFFTIRKITSNYSLILGLYYCYYFLFDIQQIRNFLAISISLFAIQFLKDKKIVTYVLLILLAASFHVSALAFLLFLLINLPNYKYFSKLFIEISALLFAILSVLNIAGANVMKRLANVLNLGSYQLYFGDNFNVLRPFIELTFFAYMAIMVYSALKTEQEDEWGTFIISLTAISFLFLPLMLISMTMDRILRPLIILDYAIIAEKYSCFDHDGMTIYVTKKNLLILGLFVVLGIMTYFYCRHLFTWIFDSNKFIFWLDGLTG